MGPVKALQTRVSKVRRALAAAGDGQLVIRQGAGYRLDEDPAELLNVMAPGGLEQYLKQVVALAQDGPPDPAQMAEIASAYDFVPAS